MESFLKKYSTEELTVLAKIPRLYRNKRAYRYMQDIIHINPDKISKSNLNYLIKHQLLEGIIGLSAEEKLKKGDKLLTREEKKLYDVILKTQWTLKHITFDYDVIKEKGNTLKSLQQRMRENNSLDNSHALQGTGKDDNVFFTLGSPQHKGAGFLHGKGGHVISLDINHFSEGGRLKESLSGLQLSDHWFQYLNQGYFSQTYGNTKREIKFFDDTGESFTLKGHKIYSYYRHDGNILTRTVSLGQEVVTGAEFFPFIAYNLILELRYIGGQYRQHLFNHLEQREIVEAAIDSFYHSSNFEATIPSQMSLNYPHITVTPQDTNSANTVDSALLMHEAISERQIDKIKNLLAVGVSIDILDDKGVTPLIKALSTYRYDIAYFLIDNGANLGLTYQKYSALAISILAGRMDIIEKILSKQIIVDDRDSTIFRQVDINRDITAISAGISRGYLSYFLSFGLNIEKFSPYIMFLLTESILSEKMVIHSINLLLQRGFKFNYGKDKKSDHYFSLTLLNAIHQQKLTLIKNLIKWGCKLNVTPLYSDHQWVDITPLMLAVTSGNMEIVEMLVKSGANINKYDKNGRTALMLAEKMKYQDIIKFLKYQSHEPKNDFVAAHKKEIAKALIYSKDSKSGKIYFLVGQKRNKKNYELFSLDSSKQAWKPKSLEDLAIKAVYSGALIDLLPHIDNRNVQKKLFDRHNFRKSNTDLVIETHEYLVDDHHKLKPYPSDKYRNVRWISASNISNRHYLISNYDYPMIESLIKNQPFNGHTYLYRLFKLNEQLFVAIKKNSCRAVEKLLVAGADANSLSDKNLTPLAIACDTPHPNLMLIQILIQHGALLNYTCCYETIACNIPHPNLTLIQTLIQHDALLNDDCFYEMRELVPLQLAILQKSKSLISLLCENGANPNQKLGTSMTPLLTACGLGNIKLIEELISYGADFKIDENKGILARLCAIPCTEDLFDYLLDHADINGLSSTQFQYTPLMVCAKLGDINRIKKLLTKGANPSIRHPRTFKSASDLAFEQKNWNVVDILRESNDIWERLSDKKLLELVTDKHSPIKKGITEFPAELAEYTDNGDYTERQKSKTKIFKIFVNRSLLQTNIFNKIANFEGAFKEFYDKNINHLRLFRERESSKIFNLDNEAVHILLDKFSGIAQSGTKEEKKLVKSFFLNRDDHRDLSHLQQWSNFPPILPYHIPYIKFVMEQRYHGKEFKLFSLGEISKFYRSSDVSFYHEVPVQTWLKIVQIELPFSDFSIDTLVAAIPLLDNLCGDKSVLEKIFKQYMDTFDQLSVLSQEAATLIRLVLVFFNSSGSHSLKKSLLNKLNWNQLSEMNIDCRLAVEDMIFLYRMHNVTLKFPSVEKQKLLGNLLLEKIKNISFVNEKITLLEQLIFTKSGYFNSPLADSVFRNEVIALWAEIILIKYGLDDASYVYYHTMKEVIDRINSEVSLHDKCYLFQQLANSIETQSGLSTYMGEIISPTETKDSIQEKNVIIIALGNALKMISKTEADKIKTLDFLSSPLTAKSLDIAVEHAMTIHNRDGIKELVQALCSCEDDYPRQYNKNDVKNALMMTYHQFWDLDLEERAGLINCLLIPTAKVLSLKDKREVYNQAFHYAVHKLFPNAQSDEQENFSKAFLIAYLQTANEYKREYLLAGIIFTLNEAADSGGKVSSPGRKLVFLCKHLGPAYAKLVQTIHSHPITSENIRLDLDHIKGHANLPYRWDLWRLMDKVLPPPEKENIARVGNLLGCSNFYNLAIECKLKNRVKNFTPFGVFATRRSIIAKPYNNTKSHQKNTLQNKQIFVTTAPRILAFAQGGTGDIDYANTVVNSLKEQYQDKITFIPTCRDETSLYQQIRLNTPKGTQPILHVIVNAPDIGFMLTPEKLQTFKDKGGYVVVTVIEFAKHSGHQNFNLKSDTITFLEKADYAIFLDDNDQKSVIEFAEKIRKKIPPSQVIATSVDVPLANKALPERGKDIISFGIIRAGKGLAHVRKLAKLMKESDNLSIQGKKILVVGTVSQGQEDKWDRTLYDLMLGVYPEQAKAMDMKKTYELVALLKEIQSNPGIKPALPIEIHLNVTENELSKLFDCCTYSYLPAYRGATLRDSSISSSLTNQFVTYVHEGKITPEYLQVGGFYQEAVSMIKYDPKKDFYSYSAETVLADIVKRERDPKLNIKTTQATLKLVNEQLSLLSVIASEHDEIYSKSISLKAMKNYPFYYLQDEGSLTIPRREIAYPLPKRYQGFNRLSQTLRHISSVVFRTIKMEFRCNPKEVQVAMIVDKLHISSNFHSDKLAPALIMAMTQDNIIEKRHIAKWDKKTNKFDREHRHLISLKQYLLNDHIFGTTVDKGIAEIKQGLGIPQHSNLSVDEITGQFIIQMKTLRSVLQRCTNGDSFGVIVHAPPKVDTVINALLKNGETATRHAERNIVQYLADHAKCIYNKSLDCFSLGVGKHVLVPMEGRFVPCGFCYEQEAVEKMPGKGGLFDPIQKRFLLHRSGYRAGKFFAREIQFFTFSSFHSNPAEARVRSVQILENIASSSPQLSIYSRPIVMNTFFNTDSEDSNEDDQISRNTHEKFQSPYKRESCLRGGRYR